MKTRVVICPSCGKQFTGAMTNDTWKCPACGYKFTSNMDELQISPFSLRNTIPDPDEIPEEDNKQPGKEISKANATIAFKLCVFFGFIGAHRFYTKKYISGIIYLLTFGLFTIGWIADIIRMFFGKFKDASGAYVDQITFAKYLNATHRKKQMSIHLTSIKSSNIIASVKEGYQLFKEKYSEK